LLVVDEHFSSIEFMVNHLEMSKPIIMVSSR
jgi:hypothetical protein